MPALLTTAAAVGSAPIPHTAGRSPMALFSIPGRGTHIPPHDGMLNPRLAFASMTASGGGRLHQREAASPNTRRPA